MRWLFLHRTRRGSGTFAVEVRGGSDGVKVYVEKRERKKKQKKRRMTAVPLASLSKKLRS